MLNPADKFQQPWAPQSKTVEIIPHKDSWPDAQQLTETLPALSMLSIRHAQAQVKSYTTKHM